MKNTLLNTTLLGISLVMGVGAAFADSPSTATVTFNFPISTGEPSYVKIDANGQQLANQLIPGACNIHSDMTTESCTYTLPITNSQENYAFTINNAHQQHQQTHIATCPVTTLEPGSTVSYDVTLIAEGGSDYTGQCTPVPSMSSSNPS
jgi:hypothetical protein